MIKNSDSFRLAVVQPRIIVEPDPEKNVEKALSYIEKASKEKIDLVLFPEGYPGRSLGCRSIFMMLLMPLVKLQKIKI